MENHIFPRKYLITFPNKIRTSNKMAVPALHERSAFWDHNTFALTYVVNRMCTSECLQVRLLEQKCWSMLDEKFDRNQTSSNIFQHDTTSINMSTTWCLNEDNMLRPTMLDDVVPTCCIRLTLKLAGGSQNPLPPSVFLV